MVEACNTGQLVELQNLFDEHGVKRENDPVPYLNRTQKGAPETSMLFNAAISHGHESIVRYLHSVYPTFDFWDCRLVLALSERPDLDMLKLLYSYSPRFIHLVLDDRESSLLSLAFRGGPKNADFIHFLLNHGVNPSNEGSYMLRLGGDIMGALDNSQPTDIIKKMVPKTAYLFYPICKALKLKRTDALELLLDEDIARGEHSSDPSYGEMLLEEARATEDKKVVAVVERYARNLERQARKSAAEDLRSKSTETRKWWQRGLPMDNKEMSQPEGSGISTPADNTTKSWWPLSKIQNKLKSADSHQKEKDVHDSFSDEDL
ncbi:hypothetical protein LTS15_004954 [Exophiala xenobiotica]|nr:hypothetical protein LTS15_004954 [Exophiala xenobiotica]